MPLPDLRVVAEGDATGGERWYLKAGSAADYYTMLETSIPMAAGTKAAWADRRCIPVSCITCIPAGLIRVLAASEIGIRWSSHKPEQPHR
jgi:hypothetical protein